MAALWHKGEYRTGHPVSAVVFGDGNDRNALRHLTEASDTVKYQNMEPEYVRTKAK
jgi:hypothetical protein